MSAPVSSRSERQSLDPCEGEKHASRHYLFISTYIGNAVGGTETLMARMSKWLLDRGNTVTVLANDSGPCKNLFDARVQIFDARADLFDCAFAHRARRHWKRWNLPAPDVIKSFDLTAAWISSTLSKVLHSKPKVVFGSYMPNVVPERNRLRNVTAHLFLANLKRCFCDSSIICMSREHVNALSKHFGGGRLPIFWPLPVGDPRPAGYSRAPRPGHIVSIGRLDPMKEYNLYMVDVVRELRQQGWPVTWSVYGDGVMTEDVRRRVHERGLEDVIQLKGTLPYTRFAEALADAAIFVGMGTAIVEAGLCGVPGVVALAHDLKGLTYGPLYSFPFGNTGESTDVPPDRKVAEELKRILSLSDSQYAEEAERTRQYALQYQMDATMERFLEIVSASGPANVSPALLACYYPMQYCRTLWSWTSGLRNLLHRRVPESKANPALPAASGQPLAKTGSAMSAH